MISDYRQKRVCYLYASWLPRLPRRGTRQSPARGRSCRCRSWTWFQSRSGRCRSWRTRGTPTGGSWRKPPLCCPWREIRTELRTHESLSMVTASGAHPLPAYSLSVDTGKGQWMNDERWTRVWIHWSADVRIAEQMNVWMNEWMNEWVSERRKKGNHEGMIKWLRNNVLYTATGIVCNLW